MHHHNLVIIFLVTSFLDSGFLVFIYLISKLFSNIVINTIFTTTTTNFYNNNNNNATNVFCNFVVVVVAFFSFHKLNICHLRIYIHACTHT